MKKNSLYNVLLLITFSRFATKIKHMHSTIFITYNSNVDIEEHSALRLQTIAHLYGLNIVLPYRIKSQTAIHNETKLRIDYSKFIVAFAVTGLSRNLKNELLYAIEKKKPIIVIYDKTKGKTLHFKKYSNVNEVFVDFKNHEESLHSIAQFLRKHVYNKELSTSKKSTSEKESGLGAALIGIGLALLAVWALSGNKKN